MCIFFSSFLDFLFSVRCSFYSIECAVVSDQSCSNLMRALIGSTWQRISTIFDGRRFWYFFLTLTLSSMERRLSSHWLWLWFYCDGLDLCLDSPQSSPNGSYAHSQSKYSNEKGKNHTAPCTLHKLISRSPFFRMKIANYQEN